LKILYIAYEVPFFPGGTGGEIRQYCLLQELVQRHDYHYVGPYKEGDRFQILQRFFKKLYMPKKRTLSDKICSFVSKRQDQGFPQFVQICEWHRHELIPLVKLAVAQNKYDLIHVEHTNIAHWLHEIASDLPKVIVSHNVKTIMWKRYADHAHGKLKRKYERDYKRFKEYEGKYLNDFDCVCAVSETDREAFDDICNGSVPIKLVPNGCDTVYFKPDSSSVITGEMVFAGTMYYDANIDAMLFFCDKILPLIQAQFPSCHVTIVGRNPPNEIIALEKLGNVKVTGFVKDVRPYLKSANVIVVPLSQGSGTRLKILDAMAMGKAIVSTTIGAEGIDYGNGKNIMIADEPEDFAKCVLDLIRNEGLCTSLGVNARDLVDEKYSWKIIANQLDEAYRFAVETRRNFSNGPRDGTVES